MSSLSYQLTTVCVLILYVIHDRLFYIIIICNDMSCNHAAVYLRDELIELSDNYCACVLILLYDP
jgi:hypothetical protein